MDPVTALERNYTRRLRVATEIRAANDELGHIIREAFERGMTGSQIATRTHLSKARVFQIRDGRS